MSVALFRGTFWRERPQTDGHARRESQHEEAPSSPRLSQSSTEASVLAVGERDGGGVGDGDYERGEEEGGGGGTARAFRRRRCRGRVSQHAQEGGMPVTHSPLRLQRAADLLPRPQRASSGRGGGELRRAGLPPLRCRERGDRVLHSGRVRVCVDELEIVPGGVRSYCSADAGGREGAKQKTASGKRALARSPECRRGQGCHFPPCRKQISVHCWLCSRRRPAFIAVVSRFSAAFLSAFRGAAGGNKWMTHRGDV